MVWLALDKKKGWRKYLRLQMSHFLVFKCFCLFKKFSWFRHTKLTAEDMRQRTNAASPPVTFVSAENLHLNTPQGLQPTPSLLGCSACHGDRA